MEQDPQEDQQLQLPWITPEDGEEGGEEEDGVVVLFECVTTDRKHQR